MNKLQTIKKNKMKYIITITFALLSFFVQAQNGKHFLELADFEVGKTSLNTSNSDYAPSFVDGELWYSAFTDDEIEKLSKGKTKGVFYNLYSTSTDAEGELVGEKQLRFEELSSGYHAGPVSYCKATGELFVTLSSYDDILVKNTVFQKAEVRLKIVVLKKVDGEWEQVDEFSYNNPTYSVGHPAISSTGDTLYFATDMPLYGHIGKTDIYMSVRDGNKKWGEPKNLGALVNTKDDDMFPSLFQDHTLLFASRGRDSEDVQKTDLDMYYSVLSEGEFSTPVELSALNTAEDDFGLVIHENEKLGYFTSRRVGGIGNDDIYKLTIESPILVRGKVIDDVTEEAIAGAKVVLSDCNGMALESLSDNAGDFSFRVKASDCLKAEASKAPYNKDEQAVEDNYVVLRLKGDYKLELTVKSKKTQQPMVNVPVVFTGLASGTTNGNGVIYRDLAGNTDYGATSEMDGYMNESVEFTTKGQAFGIIKATIYVEKVEIGQTFVLDNIYYDFDKWDILPDSEIELDKLIKVMNDNPDWKVELGSHTDSRGSDSYNEWLSQKRSDSAVKYIVEHGIPSERIVAKGYGETQLVNKCSNGVSCSGAEHRKNRRTEFKILGM